MNTQTSFIYGHHEAEDDVCLFFFFSCSLKRKLKSREGTEKTCKAHMRIKERGLWDKEWLHLFLLWDLKNHSVSTTYGLWKE